eukprot:362412-Chlamydomonas_euryale.AAC.1
MPRWPDKPLLPLHAVHPAHACACTCRYAMFEHAYYCRDGDESRSVFRFTNIVAPSKACVFPLLNKPELNEVGVGAMITGGVGWLPAAQ